MDSSASLESAERLIIYDLEFNVPYGTRAIPDTALGGIRIVFAKPSFADIRVLETFSHKRPNLTYSENIIDVSDDGVIKRYYHETHGNKVYLEIQLDDPNKVLYTAFFSDTTLLFEGSLPDSIKLSDTPVDEVYFGRTIKAVTRMENFVTVKSLVTDIKWLKAN